MRCPTSYYNILLTIGLTQVTLLLIAVVLHFKKKPAALTFLGIFLINLTTVSFIVYLFLEKGPAALVPLRGVGNLFFLAFGPTLLMYLKVELIPDYQMHRRDLVHLTPFIVTTILLVPFATLPGDEILWHYQNDKIGSRLLGNIFVIIVLGLYLIKCWLFLKEHKKNLAEVSADEMREAFAWYYLHLLIACGAWLLGTTLVIFGMKTELGLLLFEFLTLSFVAIALLSHIRSRAYEVNGEDAELISQKHKNIRTISPRGQANGYSVVSEEELEAYRQKIENLINSEPEFFCKPNLQLSHLAKEIGVPSYLASQVINRGLNKNFYELVNEQRILRAKDLLKDPESGHKTILDVAYEVGFNSKSTFNTAFKRYVGETPSKYMTS